MRSGVEKDKWHLISLREWLGTVSNGMRELVFWDKVMCAAFRSSITSTLLFTVLLSKSTASFIQLDDAVTLQANVSLIEGNRDRKYHDKKSEFNELGVKTGLWPRYVHVAHYAILRRRKMWNIQTINTPRFDVKQLKSCKLPPENK